MNRVFEVRGSNFKKINNETRYCCVCVCIPEPTTYRPMNPREHVIFITGDIAKELNITPEFFCEQLSKYGAIHSHQKVKYNFNDDGFYYRGGHLFYNVADAQKFMDEFIEPLVIANTLCKIA